MSVDALRLDAKAIREAMGGELADELPAWINSHTHTGGAFALDQGRTLACDTLSKGRTPDALLDTSF